MKALAVVLPDSAFGAAEIRARQEGIEVSALCGGLLTDILLAGVVVAPPRQHILAKRSIEPLPRFDDKQRVLLRDGETVSAFDVSSEFADYPRQSTDFAQTIVDEVIKLGVHRIWRAGRRIRVDPNFIDINYLLKQGGRKGVALSLYGRTSQFENSPKGLRTGRTPSYSFMLVESKDDLASALRLIRRAYELKFGPPTIDDLPEF